MAERWATFDCYGTLIDWNGGIRSALQRLWPDADSERLLTYYHAVEPLLQQDGALPYRAVLTRGLRAVAAIADLPLARAAAAALADSLPTCPAFPEVPDALPALRDRGWRSSRTPIQICWRRRCAKSARRST